LKAVDLQRRTGRDLSDLEARLGRWLARRPSSFGRLTAVTGARYAAGAGTANETVLADVVTTRGGREETVGIVVRLTVPGSEAYLDPDLIRQAQTLEWVAAHTEVPVPAVVAVEPAGDVLGAPFIVLEQIDGRVPPDFPVYNASGFVAEMSAGERRRLWESALDTMIELHRADMSSVDFLPGGLDGGLRELVAYWRRMFEWVESRTRLDTVRPYLDWVERHMPLETPRGLSWGDARLGNMMFAGTRCVAVLDWEMVSLGGPLIDLSWWLMFDVNHSTDASVARLDGLGTRVETIARWEKGTGYRTGDLAWHAVFSLLQLAILRANAFEQRARLALPVPDDDDPRSVLRLVRRMDAVLAEPAG
jgi:aminoglycoside phosphotransferase (APT) family kinase protein